MEQNRKVLIIGEIFVDTHLDIINDSQPLIRLGGVMHACRALSALKVPYALGYYAPQFLDESIKKFTNELNSTHSSLLYTIKGSSNVMLINDSKEAGHQGYINLLDSMCVYDKNVEVKDILKDISPTDVIVFPSKLDITDLISTLHESKINVHIDLNYDSKYLFDEANLPILAKVRTLIISTSSDLYKEKFDSSQIELTKFVKQFEIENLIIKENRGGSYYYNSVHDFECDAPSFIVKTSHSVGVGDVFNVAFLTSEISDYQSRLRFSSFVASLYASTFNYNYFADTLSSTMENYDEIISQKGIRIRWDERKNKKIYIAAPDFKDVDTRILDDVGRCLEYHNFTPLFPIRINGQWNEGMEKNEETEMFYNDLKLMQDSDLLIAVLLYNDPGTLVELGIFYGWCKPTIIFDPYGICNNMFVRNTPDHYCTELTDLIEKTYLCLGERV